MPGLTYNLDYTTILAHHADTHILKGLIRRRCWRCWQCTGSLWHNSFTVSWLDHLSANTTFVSSTTTWRYENGNDCQNVHVPYLTMQLQFWYPAEGRLLVCCTETVSHVSGFALWYRCWSCAFDLLYINCYIPMIIISAAQHSTSHNHQRPGPRQDQH